MKMSFVKYICSHSIFKVNFSIFARRTPYIIFIIIIIISHKDRKRVRRRMMNEFRSKKNIKVQQSCTNPSIDDFFSQNWINVKNKFHQMSMTVTFNKCINVRCMTSGRKIKNCVMIPWSDNKFSLKNFFSHSRCFWQLFFALSPHRRVWKLKLIS